MRFLVDANLSPRVAVLLSGAGFESIHVGDVDLLTATDQAILAYAAANELVGQIRDRMPLILAREDYGRWLSDEPDAHELMKSFPAEAMRMWPVSTRVNKPSRAGRSAPR